MSLADPLRFEAFVTQLLRLAQRDIERDGSLVPQAHLVITKDPRDGTPLTGPKLCILVPDRTFGPDREQALRAKDQYAGAVREVVARGGAIGVVTLLEVWLVLGDGTSVGSVPAREDPRREEGVIALIEHRSGIRRHMFGRILRGTKRARLSGFTPIAAGVGDGARFSWFLPQKEEPNP